HDAIAMQLTDAGVPVLDGTYNALIAVRGALAHRDFRQRPVDPLPTFAPRLGAEARRVAEQLVAAGPLDEANSLALLAAYGVPVVPHCVVDSDDAATAAATRLGYPVALKTAVPGILHKSEARGVHLDLADEAAVRGAWRDLAERLGPRAVVACM